MYESHKGTKIKCVAISHNLKDGKKKSRSCCVKLYYWPVKNESNLSYNFLNQSYKKKQLFCFYYVCKIETQHIFSN